ncbi:MAG: class I SAM-dependent methyltransferase [Thermodesulfobacteriota bacterium]
MNQDGTDFYQNHFREYFKRTVAINPAPFLTPLIDNLAKDATVLDIGCGSGRDLLWLKERGFRVTGFERSPGLAKLAAAHAGCDVITGDFEQYDFSRFSFDAVMACGSLVHVPQGRLAGVLQNILRALTPSGISYVSLKQGRGLKSDAFGRTFYFWEKTLLDELWRELGLTVVHAAASRSALNSGDDWLAYVLRPLPAPLNPLNLAP